MKSEPDRSVSLDVDSTIGFSYDASGSLVFDSEKGAKFLGLLASHASDPRIKALGSALKLFVLNGDLALKATGGTTIKPGFKLKLVPATLIRYDLEPA